MSNHNYSQYANKKPTNSEPASMDRPSFKVEVHEVKMVEESIETVTLPKMVTGAVFNCVKLNVRETPSADANILCVLDANTEIEINVDKTTSEWACICTAAGIEGYCMRKFIDARL